MRRSYLGSQGERDALNTLEAVCRSKGWRIALRLCERSEVVDGGVRNAGRIEDLDVLEVMPDSGLELSDGSRRANEREVIARASIKPGDRLGHAAMALLEHMTRAGLVVFDQERKS